MQLQARLILHGNFVLWVKTNGIAGSCDPHSSALFSIRMRLGGKMTPSCRDSRGQGVSVPFCNRLAGRLDRPCTTVFFIILDVLATPQVSHAAFFP